MISNRASQTTQDGDWVLFTSNPLQTDTIVKYKTRHLNIVTVSNCRKHFKFFLSLRLMVLVADWSQFADRHQTTVSNADLECSLVCFWESDFTSQKLFFHF